MAARREALPSQRERGALTGPQSARRHRIARDRPTERRDAIDADACGPEASPTRAASLTSMSLPGTQAPPKNKATFRPPRALLGGRKARTLPPPPEKVSWNGLERQPVRPAPARTADVFSKPVDATDPAQLKRLGVYDYRTSALAMSLNHTDVTPTVTINKIKKRPAPAQAFE